MSFKQNIIFSIQSLINNVVYVIFDTAPYVIFSISSHDISFLSNSLASMLVIVAIPLFLLGIIFASFCLDPNLKRMGMYSFYIFRNHSNNIKHSDMASYYHLSFPLIFPSDRHIPQNRLFPRFQSMNKILIHFYYHSITSFAIIVSRISCFVNIKFPLRLFFAIPLRHSKYPCL